MNKTERWLTIPKVALILVISVGLFFVLAPMAFHQTKKSDLSITVSNGKQIGQALVAFEQDYGSFPDNQTAAEMEKHQPGTQLRGEFSNDYLRQLIIAKTVDTEMIFGVKLATQISEGDNLIQGNQAIAEGENGWAYVINKDGSGFQTEKDSKHPVLMTSLISYDSQDFLFDPGPSAKQHAVIIRADISAEAPRLGKPGLIKTSELFPTVTGKDGKQISSFHKTQILFPEGINFN